VSGEPFPKASQLARGERRYRRKIASPKQWQAIIAAKGKRCRLCASPAWIQYHHLVPRDRYGDDVEDNIVPLCLVDHELVTRAHRLALYRLGESLTDAEYAYVVAKLGEGGMERLFGVSRGA